MRNKIMGIVLFVILSASLTYARYDSYNTQKDDYTPPFDFIKRPIIFPEEGGEKKGGPVRYEFIEQLSRQYSEGEPPSLKNSFGADHFQEGIDPALYQKMSDMAADGLDRVIDHIRGQIVLDELKALSLLRHPGIQAARKKVRAEIQSFDQISNLDDSLRQYRAFTRALNNKAGPIKGRDSIEMGFPSPGVTALKGRIVDAQVSVRIENTTQVAQQVVKGVSFAYWDLIYVEQSTGITRETISAFQRLHDVAMVLYKSGKTSFQDVIKINIKLEELREGLVSLESRRGVIHGRILELIALPAGLKIGHAKKAVQPPFIPDPRDLYPVAQKNRRELQALRFQVAKVTAMVALAETMVEAKSSLGFSLSDHDFVSTTGTDAQGQAFATQTMAAMKNNNPERSWYGINEPWLAQTRQTLLGLKKTLEEKENAAERMVKGAWFKADKKRREHALYHARILPLAKSALDVSTREYEAGSIPFSQAIDSYTYWLKVQLLIAQRQSDFGKAVADLENIIGTPITRTP